MPFTPFHFGPGLLFKSLAPQGVSWCGFVASQVLIDCETAYYLTRHEYPLHRVFHGFVGATIAGLASSLAMLVIVKAMRSWNDELDSLIEYYPALSDEFGARAIVIGGVLGGLSHTVLDGIMHSDVRPFAPFSNLNPFLGLLDFETLHYGCILAGILALVILAVRAFLKSSKAREPEN